MRVVDTRDGGMGRRTNKVGATGHPTHGAGTGYRSGVLVVERATGLMGVTQPRTTDGIRVMPLDGGEPWTVQGTAGLRLATEQERAKLGLGPRRVD
ncbi:hypothetical protein CK936_01805 [Streptomyces albireticuli]|uniref:Uncharacterized protein n=2 Tax=Streptomyces albireticuli TaxID=1940 RepID=A0A2A2DH04_9ACTN|nr:hypothetical protein CK936_01805 [Streptomyces albireticuli]